MNSLAGIQLLCFKNIYIFSPAQAFSIDQWKYCRRNGDSRGNLLLFEQLLIPSHSAEAKQLPSTLVDLHKGEGECEREWKRMGGRRRSRRLPRSASKPVQVQLKEIVKIHTFFSSSYFCRQMYQKQQCVITTSSLCSGSPSCSCPNWASKEIQLKLSFFTLSPNCPALAEKPVSHHVCSHHSLPRSPGVVSAWLAEDRTSFAPSALGDAQAHVTFDRIQRCFFCG